MSLLAVSTLFVPNQLVPVSPLLSPSHTLWPGWRMMTTLLRYVCEGRTGPAVVISGSPIQTHIHLWTYDVISPTLIFHLIMYGLGLFFQVETESRRLHPPPDAAASTEVSVSVPVGSWSSAASQQAGSRLPAQGGSSKPEVSPPSASYIYVVYAVYIYIIVRIYTMAEDR